MVRVIEADLVDIVLSFSDFCRRGGRRELKNAIGISHRGNGDAGLCGSSAHEDLHTPVHQIVVGVDGFFDIVLIVLRVQRELNAAFCVDFIDSKLRTVFGGNAVHGRVTCQRTDQAELQSIAAFGILFTTASKKAQNQSCNHYNTHYFFHFHFLLS